jgi:hypothetical protein
VHTYHHLDRYGNGKRPYHNYIGAVQSYRGRRSHRRKKQYCYIDIWQHHDEYGSEVYS